MKKIFAFLSLLLPLLVSAQTSYFTTSGYTVTGNITSAFREDYQTWEDITFNLDPTLAATANDATWTFTSSETGAVLKTATGSSPKVNFTLAEGIFGVDVKVQVTRGKYPTIYNKRHRIMMRPDTRTVNYTVNLSNGLADPFIKDLGGTQYALDLSPCHCGDKLRLMGSISTLRMQVINAPNCTRSNPLWIVITSPTTITKTGTTYDEAFQLRDGTNGLVIYSLKDASGNRYFTINGGGIGTTSTVVANSHNDVSISGVKIINAQATAIKFKLDNVDRFINACSNLWVYDNELGYSTFENTYFGDEAAFGFRFDTGFNGGDYHHTMRGLKFFANWTHHAGYDGAQMTGADLNTEVHDNLFESNGTSNTFAQDFSISAAGGFTGQIFNNIFDRPIQLFPNGDTYVYNNYIPGHIDPAVNNGVFMRRYDNPMLVGPNGDSYQHSSSTGRLFMFNNYITSIQDPAYILDGNDAGTGKVPLAAIYYFNNTLTWSGTAMETSGLRYTESGGSPIVTQTPNLITPTRAGILIHDEAGHNLAAEMQSPVFAAANEGTDVTAIVAPSALKIGLSDMTGQSYPVRGYFRNAPVQRPYGYTEPSTFVDMYQWYQTAQTTNASGYSDKVAIPDMYGYKVKTYNFITGGSKPRLVPGYTPVAKTGTLVGTEVFDTVSN